MITLYEKQEAKGWTRRRKAIAVVSMVAIIIGIGFFSSQHNKSNLEFERDIELIAEDNLLANEILDTTIDNVFELFNQAEQEDSDEDMENLLLLAEQGDAKAQYNLGRAFSEGHSVEQDYEQAFYWYKLAADQGYDPAQVSLGNMYLFARGVEQDHEQAFYWYRLAGEQGNVDILLALGTIYSLNISGASYEQAAYWYALAANQGNDTAQYRLGWMYEYGHGVDQDNDEAMRWYALAANQGHEEAKDKLDEMQNK